jgi:predicted nucleic acid-binding protein
LVPLIVEERHSKACRQVLRSDPTQIVWCLTRTEILSAIWRRQREGLLDARDVRLAESRLEKLAVRWTEVDALPPVRDAAERLLRVHRLRAADALQLGACLVVFGPHPRGREFVALDEELARAAEREGFTLLLPGPP